MRAVLCREFGPFENLAVEEVAPPAMTAKGVRIRHAAAGVSFATAIVVAGRYQRKPPLPFAPGTEAAGVVGEVGPEVTRFRPGDRVIAVLPWGGHAEESVVHEATVYPAPPGIDLAEATNLPLSYATAYAALVWKAKLVAGEALLVHGAGGAVGLAVVEIAKFLGARVIATAGTEEKLVLARAHGADETLILGADLVARIRALTEGRGVDVVIDPIGGEASRQSLRCLAFDGRILTIGFASGDVFAFPSNHLLVKNVSAIGLNYGIYVGWTLDGDRPETHETRVRELQGDLAEWYAAGKLRPVVSHRFPIERFQEAMATVQGRESRGKVALVFPGVGD